MKFTNLVKSSSLAVLAASLLAGCDTKRNITTDLNQLPKDKTSILVENYGHAEAVKLVDTLFEAVRENRATKNKNGWVNLELNISKDTLAKLSRETSETDELKLLEIIHDKLLVAYAALAGVDTSYIPSSFFMTGKGSLTWSATITLTAPETAYENLARLAWKGQQGLLR